MRHPQCRIHRNGVIMRSKCPTISILSMPMGAIVVIHSCLNSINETKERITLPINAWDTAFILIESAMGATQCAHPQSGIHPWGTISPIQVPEFIAMRSMHAHP
ncbi:hypothetical protein AVEN_138723-1 [Araneus ventricosus]|uniref:Uncharacterized protein n=1 Tax=Araneus ventricosus TaxID=182803 RepID=A0A4Y2V8G9_ARAVE|nr:hypothetical protein AVEN_138723-1 [Araneus ventricosus]